MTLRSMKLSESSSTLELPLLVLSATLVMKRIQVLTSCRSYRVAVPSWPTEFGPGDDLLDLFLQAQIIYGGVNPRQE